MDIRIYRISFYMLNMSHSRPLPAGLFHRTHMLRISLQHHLDGSVISITNPSGDRMLSCIFTNKISKSYSLYSAVEMEQMSDNMIHFIKILYLALFSKTMNPPKSVEPSGNYCDSTFSFSFIMVIDQIFLALGIVMLYAGAELLVQGSVALSRRFRIPPLLIGLVVIGFGTSSPELIVSIEAAIRGNGEIAVGNVIGSNITNIALILGAGAVIYPIGVQISLLKLELPVLIASSVLVTLLIFNGVLTRLNGMFLIAGLLIYLLISIRSNLAIAFSEQKSTYLKGHAIFALLRSVTGLALLIYGAHLMITGSLGLARAYGISEAVIGLTVVAVGTSLPELATAIVASIKKQGDLILGALIGSNIFNLLFILGTTVLVRPIVLVDITLIDLGMMTLLALFLVPIARTGLVVSRWEGVLLLATYAGYFGYLYLR